MNEQAETSEAAQAASFLLPDTPGAEVMSSQAAHATCISCGRCLMSDDNVMAVIEDTV